MLRHRRLARQSLRVAKRGQRAGIIPRQSATGGSDRSAPYRGLAPELLTKVRNGACALSSEWDVLFGEGRLRSLAHAVAARTENPSATNCHATAAALHQLPLYRTRTDRVELIVPGLHTRKNSDDVVRRHLALEPSDVEIVDGLRVTTLERTVYDVIRSLSLEAAVVCCDAAMRHVAWDEGARRYDLTAAEAFREGVLRRIAKNAGARGIRQARFVASFADGRAQLPGESVSRLWMWQCGIPDPELQLRVELGVGRFALLDFAWPGLGRWAEFDGEIKYSDEGMLGGRSPDAVRSAQDAREAQIRRATGWRVDRWGFDRMASFEEFAAHLRRIRLLPPSRMFACRNVAGAPEKVGPPSRRCPPSRAQTHLLAQIWPALRWEDAGRDTPEFATRPGRT